MPTNDDGESVYSASVYSAIPVQVEFSSFHEDDDDDDDISIVSLDNKYQAKQDSQYHHSNNYSSSSSGNNNNNGFIFGLRIGFSSQFIMGSVVLFGYHDEFSAAMNTIQGTLLVTAAMCAITVIMTLLSNKLHTCLKKKKQSSSSSSSLPPGRYQEQPLLQTSTHAASEQDYHLYYGTLLGMFLGWILFDLIMENGLTILGIHSAVSLVGYLYLRRRSRDNSLMLSSKKRKLPSPLSSGRRSPVSDDLLRSLDLA